ncbi:MAG: VWA domain-containing protein [Bryobacteraceae bacterium]|jgi:VWFA-related protein
MKFAAVLLCFTGVLAAQPNTVIKTETREVLVDAIVTGKNGAYVSDLTAKDFHLSEDGKEQAIRGFALQSSSAAAQPRSLLLFFDETSMEVRDQIAVRQAAASFIDAEASPSHRMAIVTFNGSLRIAQSFTDNAGRLKDALAQASFHGLAPSAADSDRSHDPSRAKEDRLAGPARASGSAAANSMQVRNMIRSLGDLGRSLGVLPGRKIVIVFTGTLSSSSDQKSEVRYTVDAANKSGVAFYPMDVRPIFDQTNPGDAPLSLERAPSSMQRGGAQGAGPQGDSDALSSPLSDSGAGSQQILFGLANGTGGFVVSNSADLLGGLQNIAKEQNQYYSLTYVAPESKEESCHSLRVKVDRKGTKVRSRTSYCTAKPLDLLAGTTAGKDLENRAAGPEAGGIAASMELPYFYLSPNVARVNLAMEIPADALKFQNQKGKQHAEINLLGIASTADGSVGARFSDAAKFDFENEAEIEKVKGKSLHYEKEFKVAPGQYRFTLAFSSGGQSFGKLEAPLVVEPRKPEELALSGIVLSKEAHPAADLGLGLGVSATGDGTPLVAQGMQVIPAGSYQFMKSEPAFFYFEIYDSNPASVSAQVRILDRNTAMSKWDSGLLKLSVPQQGGNLPLNTLTAGAYQLEVTAVGSSGVRVKRTADFDVK